MPNIKSKLTKKEKEKEKAILTPLKEPLKITKKETKEQAEIRKICTQKLKLDTKFINEILKTYEGAEKRILNNINFTIKKFEQGKIKESLGGFLRTALKNDYAKHPPIFDIKEEKKKQALQEEKNKLAATQLLKKFSAYKSHKIEDYKNNNPKVIKNLVPIFIIKNMNILKRERLNIEDIEEIEKAIKNKRSVKSFFNTFLENEHFKNEILTFEEWAKNQNIND